MSCVICLDSLLLENGHLSVIKCGHAFHKLCLERWRKCSSLCPTCKLRFITVWPLFLSHRGDNESRIIAEGHTSISQEAQQRSSTRAVENQRNIMPPSTHNIQSQRIVRRRNTTANVVMNQAQQNEGNVLSPTSTRNRKQVQRLNYNTITCYVCHKKIQTTDSLGAMARIACSFKCMNEFNNS